MAKFRARARTVDMLGRQQIAGAPNAISELFKNAHDAYAERVVGNLIRFKDTLMIRDDGMGMTEEEFLSRWLVLGTESRVATRSAIARPSGAQIRPILGEKGIGRLAIAVLGPQVLVLSQRRGTRDPMVAAFVNWRLFEIPGLNLDDIDVPVRTMARGTMPSAADVEQLVSSLRKSVKRLTSVPRMAVQEVLDDLDAFHVDPAELVRSFPGPSLVKGYGTHFYVSPFSDALTAEIDFDKDEGEESSRLITTLIGFTNTMTPNHPKPVIKTSFFDHKTLTDFHDLIESNEFFTPREFRLADHHIAGKFDEQGTFKGKVAIFGGEPLGVVVPYRKGKLTSTKCGPFSINVAVVQGQSMSSRIAPDEYGPLKKKMDVYGGLYIYKDNIRVLPYGNADYDFLEVEKNRSKGAGYYYFSYRRLFGVIQLSSRMNSGLQEKAGREGFQENESYRQFRRILKNFLRQLAQSYFNERDKSSEFSTERDEIERLNRAKKARAAEEAAVRREVERQLAAFSDAFASNEPRNQVTSVLSSLERKLQRMDGNDAKAVSLVSDLEAGALADLGRIENQYRMTLPRGIAIPPELRSEVAQYQDRYRRFAEADLHAAKRRVPALVSDAVKTLGVRLTPQKRLLRALEDKHAHSERIINEDVAGLRGELRRLADDIESISTTTAKQLRTEVEKAKLSASDGQISDIVSAFDAKLTAITLAAHAKLGELAQQLTQVRVSNGKPSQLAIYESLQEELLELRARTEEDLELAQLGMAVQVINHEFDATIREIRSALRELKVWARANVSLRDLQSRLTTSFEHLDNYLTLFTPLQRRLYRSTSDIAGGEIRKFLADLFADRFSKDEISFSATSAFNSAHVQAIRSTLYPVFVNLVDNAIYWLKRVDGDRAIQLDARGEDLYVSNTGPAVPDSDRQRIFEYGFSRKPSGQGLGLFISREVLRREGFGIECIRPLAGFNVSFRISKQQQQ